MANPSYVESLTGGLDAALRRVFKNAADYILNNLRIGRIQEGKRSENFQLYFYKATTPGVANQEFSIAHGLGRPPYLLVQVLPLDAVGAQIARLQVSRAADSERIYLSSPDTNATIFVALEV